MSTINLIAGLGAVDDDEPKEGRKIISFTPPLNFVTGNEQFSWNSKALGNQPLTSIQSAWIDGSNLVPLVPGTSFDLFITMAGRKLSFVFPAFSSPNVTLVSWVGQQRPQGFHLTPSALPFEMDISLSPAAAASGLLIVNLYNFNVFALGIKHAKDVVKWLDRQNKKGSHINTGAVKS